MNSLTVAQLKERVDLTILAQLTDPNGTTADDVKLARALTDAAAMVDGHTFKLAASDVPPAATLQAHQVSLALWILAGNRPGAEFDSIRSRATAATKFLEGLSESQAAGIETETTTPTAAFDADNLAAFRGQFDASST
jgi:phage gp36-like protein